MTLGLRRGRLEPGETPEAAAVRELAEGGTAQAAEWRKLGRFWAAPGYSTELVHAFEARDLSAVVGASLDPDEDVEVERLPLAGAMGKLSDAVSVAALRALAGRAVRLVGLAPGRRTLWPTPTGRAEQLAITWSCSRRSRAPRYPSTGGRGARRRRRAIFLLAAGGDPERGLDLDGRAVTAMAKARTVDRQLALERG